MNSLTYLKFACIIALFSTSLSVSALDLNNPFGKKKKEAKEESQKETLATLEPKLAEQEAKISSMKEDYAKKDPEAGSLMTKVKGYGKKLSDMNTEYGNVTGKLDTYLSGKYPKYKKASDSYSALKNQYDSMKAGSSKPKEEKKKKSGWGSALGDAAKSTLGDAKAGSASAVKEKMEAQQATLTTMREELSKETPEGKKLLAEAAEMKAEMTAAKKDQASTDMELTALLKKRYPDFKSVNDDYELLKKKYDEMKAEKKE